MNLLEQMSQTDLVSAELAELAERVRASVVVVRGSRGGSGSGVVWNDRGLIVTNHHVAPGDRVEIELADGEKRAARVVARAAGQDLAAFQVEGDRPGDGLQPAAIGDSGSIRPGELVIAVGNPLGERRTVAIGVVSGIGQMPGSDGPREVIRAAITVRPGNSGGALADIRGRVIGLPQMVVGRDQALAVPSRSVETLLAGSPAPQAVFGLAGRWVEIPAALATRNNLTVSTGLLIVGVTPDSAAEATGLLVGDLLTGIFGSDGTIQPIEPAGSLRDYLRTGGHSLAIVRGGVLAPILTPARAA